MLSGKPGLVHWRGKRPFKSTQYFPTQLKEVHGEEVNGWRNMIFWGDNLQVMSCVEQTVNHCASLRIPSTFPPVEGPVEGPCPARSMRMMTRKLAALCSLLLPQCFHLGTE